MNSLLFLTLWISTHGYSVCTKEQKYDKMEFIDYLERTEKKSCKGSGFLDISFQMKQKKISMGKKWKMDIHMSVTFILPSPEPTS